MYGESKNIMTLWSEVVWAGELFCRSKRIMDSNVKLDRETGCVCLVAGGGAVISLIQDRLQ